MELLKLETEKTMRIWGLYDTEKVKRQARSIYDSQGLAPSLDTCGGVQNAPYKSILDVYVASTGRKLRTL